MKMTALKFASIAFLVFVSDAAAAQQSIIYGADGKRIGTASMDSQGTTTTRGADGRVITTETRPSHGPRACPFTTSCFTQSK